MPIDRLEPLAEVERALLVVQVLHAPHPELLGLLLRLGEHFCAIKLRLDAETRQSDDICMAYQIVLWLVDALANI